MYPQVTQFQTLDGLFAQQLELARSREAAAAAASAQSTRRVRRDRSLGQPLRRAFSRVTTRPELSA